MTATQTLITLLGEIAFLLWGIHMVHGGVIRAFGTRLQAALASGLRTRLHALIAGIVVTTVLQSSTATALMATAFAAEGTVTLAAALAVMLGANIGTTLIVQVLSFDITLVFPVLILAGYLLAKRAGPGRVGPIGQIILGLGFMLLALHLLIETMAPIESAPLLGDLLSAITADPLVIAMLAALFTWAAHSSVAAMIFIMTLGGTGAIGGETALAMVLGANLGSAVNPLLESARGDRASRRLPLGNMINRLVGCALAFPFLGPLSRALASLDPGVDRLAVNFHTLFNVALALLFLAPLPLLARLLERVLPPHPRADDRGRALYLDTSVLDNPGLALSNVAREVLRMADGLHGMIEGSRRAFLSDDEADARAVSREDDILDRLHGQIQRYVGAIDPEGLSADQALRLSNLLSFAINLEHCGDIIDKTLMDLALKRIRLRASLPGDGMVDIESLHHRLGVHISLAVAVIMQADHTAARRLVIEKEEFREIERRATLRHRTHLRAGLGADIATSGLTLDIVRDLKRIDSHIAAIAHPLLTETGELQVSRLVS
ncbi:Na/Pi cotransporter [Rhodospirillum rubrum]|uniref:Na/Pi cotransporter family protein n=1 Tax=Rhodospirillum rubrum TaxID=1085 RepID=UPI0019063289|nr:Na/Pi cotransporter family protein [Rhodospirillum rubrum]MBK1664189.1 Na/Pi cotransporter [Rhodospirillum rubrum]MBK1675790.1 Na/Pi cotransporter [Rhodospirillum rubrum]